MSGFPTQAFGAGGYYAPVSLSGRVNNNLAAHLAKLGYETILIYPVRGGFLNARNAYKNYGFKHLYFAEDLKLPYNWTLVDDQFLFAAARAAIAKVGDRPIFVFIVTLQNHFPHADDAPGNSALVEYLRRLKNSEEALRGWNAEWLSDKKRRMTAWFGDHQPPFAIRMEYSESYLREIGQELNAGDAKRLTWYGFSSNFEPNGELYRELDISMLGAAILNYGAIPLRQTDWLALALSRKFPLFPMERMESELWDDFMSYRVWTGGDVSEKE